MRFLLTLVTLFFTLSDGFAAKPYAPTQWQTKNGARVVFFQAMEVPMLDISIAFSAGSAYDDAHFGLSALTTRLINQGNAGHDANDIADKLAETGAQFDAQSTRDMVALSLKTLTTQSALKEATDTFAMIINHPDFPLQSFNREKNQQLMGIAQDLESPDKVADQTFFKALYQKHPYAHPIYGTREHVNAITIEQVRTFYHQFFVSHNAVLVMVGAIDESTARQLAENLTKDLAQGKGAAEIPRATPLTEEVNLEIEFPSSQTMLRLGQLGINHHDKNYFPLLVGNYTLGGGALVSRLANEVREKRGLTYGVYSQFSPMPGLGPFLISLSTQTKQANTALDITRETLSAFVKQGPNKKELFAAKHYLTGSFPLSLASNRNIADMLLKIAFYHLPEDFLDTYTANINAVTAEQIKDAFQQTLHPDALLQVAVGKV